MEETTDELELESEGEDKIEEGRFKEESKDEFIYSF
jgi:hypothetical protein